MKSLMLRFVEVSDEVRVFFAFRLFSQSYSAVCSPHLLVIVYTFDTQVNMDTLCTAKNSATHPQSQQNFEQTNLTQS